MGVQHHAYRTGREGAAVGPAVEDFEMRMCKRPVFRRLGLMSAACLLFTGSCLAFGQPSLEQTVPQPTAQAPAVARPVGSVKSISGNTITLTTDAGSDVNIQVQASTKLVRIAPGQKDLKDATPIQLADIQPGDRILVRGKLADDGKSVLAASVIAMKKADIADKQAHEREEWQRHGLGGLVSDVEATGIISVSLPAFGEKKAV